ncbi:Mandelate racemase/muconate lactonizing protein (plasmid) [Sodalis praecaptivus]|uniref:Mandelate racemase/muconate lactonizing protein n=1 Tax=Sodalis praecaptivus TaxID=1239307 RepID=W0HZK0_9GAMM|nr:mandelate racemase/muconate lactonizing enzyme family protein [Sodalis praecaptivus]AHF79199.1 Mandelate racemase/muconate lactonizing protein [Sodalis praecaptivus]
MTVEATHLPPPQRGIIRQVEIWPLRIPLRGALQIAVGEKRPSLDVVIVRLVTEEGVYGLGETQAWRRQGSSETLVGLIDAMQTLLIPQMIGQSVFDLAAIAARFDEVLYGRLAAKAALLDALYDAQGHLLGVPVWQLLGGRARESIETGAVLTLRAQLEDTLDEALAFYQQGYRHFSIKAGLDIRRDIKAVSALRHALGDEARLLVDANAALAFDDARRLLHGIAPFAVDAAEQPLALHDRHGLAALAATSPVALILDESITTQADLLQWIPERAAHALHTKTAKNGGIWHSRPLWQLAHAAGWQVRAGNHPATSLATLAVAHLATAWPHTLIPSPFSQSVTHDLVADVVTEPVRVDNARLRLGTAPGWGVELDMAQIARWQRR